MSNDKKTMTKVNVCGEELDACHDGEHVWVSVRRVCEVLDISPNMQVEKLKKKPWAVSMLNISTGPDGKNYETFCLSHRSLPMWLATIEPSRSTAANLGEKLARFQMEAADVLADHFMGKRGDGVRLNLPGLRTEVIVVTPEMAGEWLEHRNNSNRPMRERVIAKYVADIKKGRWLTTHQGIAFGPGGEIIDGQHRLGAIVRAGVACTMMVTFYEDEALAREAKLKCDTGRTKSNGDVLAMAGVVEKAVADNLAAIVSAMRLIDGNTGNLSADEIRDTYEENRDAVDWVLRALPTKEFGTLPRAAFVYAYRAFPEQVDAFATMVREKAGIDAGTPAQTYLKSSAGGQLRTSGGSGERRACLLKILRILKAHVRSEKGLDKLYVTTEGLDFFKAAWERQKSKTNVLPFPKDPVAAE